MGKSEIFKLIRDKRKTLKELRSNVIDEYVDGFTKISNGSKDLKITYGVNVRLSRESSDNVVYPFSASFPRFNSVEAADKVTDGYKIPDFLSRFSLKEAVFRVDYTYSDSIIKVSKVSKIKKLTDRMEKEWYTLNPFCKSVDDSDYEEQFKSFLIESNCTFVHVNIKGLQLENEGTVYVWVCGEDPDVSVNSDGSYLTNILAITNDSNKLKEFIVSKRSDIIEFVMLLKSRKTDDADIKQKKEAIKSAKAAIISRNMSHNLGSHVMSYLKQKLGSITSILNEENEVLSNLYDGKELNEKLFLEDNNNPTIADKIKANIQMPFLVGTGRFIGYLQERQDYVATIATDYIPYGAPVNLKDAIYDEINPDLRHMRHNDADNNRPLNILLSYIAKSEGFSRENMGKGAPKERPEEKDKAAEYDLLRFKTENDILFGYAKYSKKEKKIFGLDEFNNGSDHEALSEMRAINFSLPGGLVGRQAVFSIIENLIRNAAKHGNTRNINNLEFTFDVIDLNHIGESLNIEDRITDDSYRALYSKAVDKENLYLLTITDNLIYDNDVINKLRSGLIEPYIDKYGNMTTGNKGIKEIRISAAWLRNETDEDKYLKYNDKKNSGKAPLVGVELTKEKHLRYLICIQQDRFAAVITDEMSPEDKEFFIQLCKEAPTEWKLYETSEEAQKDYKISYRYMIVANEVVYNKLRPFSSNRLTIWNSSRLRTLNKGSYSEKKNSVLQNLYNIDLNNSEPIYIWDGAAFDAHKGERESGSIPKKIVLTSADADVRDAKYVYRTHHSAEKDFYTYWNKKLAGEAYSNVVCIDAVTGDNSSDRIVRREPLDLEWYFSHLYAMKKRIAIFDERIFKIVHNIDENKFVVNSFADDELDILINVVNEKKADLASVKTFLQDQQLLKKVKIQIKVAQNVETIIGILNKLRTEFKAQYSNNYKSIVYKEKGIDVLTILEERKGVFAIVGCVEENGAFSKTHVKFDKIATISACIIGNDIEVKIAFKPEYKHFCNYDYISIHQGILDKMYEGFGIKRNHAAEVNEEDDVRRVNNQKNKVTNCLYEKFGAQKAIGEYLPCFIVHSGRAKPTVEDMPQKLPFIQYAAIEHAVQDCKYALVELLDYARYEPNDDEVY